MDASNYFESSQGTFQVIPSTWVKQIKNDAMQYDIEFMDYRYDMRGQQLPIKLGNRFWLPNYIGTSARYGSVSAYWVSQDGQYLLRVSDHWSKSFKGVHQCGKIARCWWELAGRRQPAVDGFHGGIIKLSELSERR